MGLSKVLNPETGTLEEEDKDASEGEIDVDSADPWTDAGPLGERFLWRASPALLLLFQDSGVRSFCPVEPLSDLPSWLVLPGLELVLVRAARASL